MRELNLKKYLSCAAALVLAASILVGCGAASSTASSSEAAASSEVIASSVETEAASTEAEEAKVSVTFTVTGADGTSSDFALEVTDGEKLSDALAAAGIISEEEAASGFVTTVNGELADWNADQSWWCLTDASGEMTAVGVADIELHDGDAYAFTYTK